MDALDLYEAKMWIITTQHDVRRIVENIVVGSFRDAEVWAEQNLNRHYLITEWAGEPVAI